MRGYEGSHIREMFRNRNHEFSPLKLLSLVKIENKIKNNELKLGIIYDNNLNGKSWILKDI